MNYAHGQQDSDEHINLKMIPIKSVSSDIYKENMKVVFNTSVFGHNNLAALTCYKAACL